MEPNNANQFCAPSMMQMIWQMGEKFGELKKEMMDGLKAEVGKLAEENAGFKDKLTKVEMAFNGLKAENEDLKENVGKLANANDEMEKKMAKVVEIEKQMNEFVAKNAELEGQIVEKNGELEKMKAKIQGLAKENEDSKQIVGKLAEKNGEMNEEMAKMKEEFSGKNNELKAQIVRMKEESQKLEKKTRELQEQQKTFVQNKWNLTDCGPKLVSSGEGGLGVMHFGGPESNCIRAILPIPAFNLNAEKSSIAGYFEMQIVGESKWVGGIQIGFCTQQFPLKCKFLGEEKNSIGIDRNAGMHIDGEFKEFGNNAKEYFKFGDVIGAGIILANKSMKCFSTLNGQLLGTFELPTNFLTLQLFPASSLFAVGDSILANFGEEKWRYDPSQLLK